MSLMAIMALPLAALIVSVLPLGRKAAPAATLTATAMVLALASGAGASVLANGELVAIRGWVETDALGVLILLLVAWICLLATLFSVGYLEHGAHAPDRRRVRFYYANLNLFIFALLSVPLLAEPALAWMGIEFTALFSVLLVAYERTHEALEAAWKYISMMVMGAAIALLGFMILFWAQRTAGGSSFTWSGLRETAGMPPALVATAFVLVLVGFGTEVGFVPLHTWLPDAHSQAPTPVCALLSGVKTTVALYCILRLVPLLPIEQASAWLQVVGLLSVGIAAFLLLQVQDYKRMFAFSTVEHMGIIATAVGLGAAAHSGAILQIVAHSVTKSFCFFAAGAVLLTYGTREISAVRGVLRRSPAAGAALLLGALAIAGAPPMNVFLSELTIFRAGLADHHFTTTALLALFIVIAFAGIMRQANRMVFGAGDAGSGERALSDDGPDPSTRAPSALAQNERVGGRSERPRLPLTSRVTLGLGAIPVLLLGVWMPAPLYVLVQHAAKVLAP
jgi:hydrogenase-4 component F